MPSFTITVTASEGNRAASAIGEIFGLVDNQVPPQRRDATLAECKQFMADYLKKSVQQIERARAQNAVSVTPFDPT